MRALSIKEQLWGSLAHIPFITFIWIGYLIYTAVTQGSLYTMIVSAWQEHTSGPASLPIAPLLLTGLSIPISLTVMHLKKASKFIHKNAQEAYFFNVWLLKGYGIFLVIAGIGLKLGIKAMLLGSGICISLLSLSSFIQSICAVTHALRGNVYHYWYPKAPKR